MKFKELKLISFGKFQEKVIKFEDKLNVIYGQNESGKTTIHNFIDGMFYGFLRPYVSRRYYRVEYEKYRPWNKQVYKGVLRFSKSDIMYRIERDFRKGQVKVYEDLTGRDISQYMDTGERVKVHLPGMYFFNFNTTVYNNTVSVKQLGNKIDSNLAKEIKDRLVNISSSLDDEISVRDALYELEKQLEDIGTQRAYTRPYGKAKMELDKLKEKRKGLLQKQREYKEYIEQFYILKKQIGGKKLEIQKSRETLEKIQMFQIRKTYDEGLNLKNKLDEINKKIESLRKYSQLSFNEYTKGLKMDNDKDVLQRQVSDLLDRIQCIEDQLREIKAEKEKEAVKGIDIRELYNDIGLFNDMDEERNELIIGSQSSQLEILNSELKYMKEKLNKSKIQTIILLLLTVVSLGLSLINQFIISLTPILAGIAFYIRGLYKKRWENIKRLSQKIEKKQLEEDKKSDRIQRIDKYQNNIIKKYNCLSKIELNRLYDDIRLQLIAQKDKEERKKCLKKEIKDLKAKLQVKNIQKLNLIKEIGLFMKKNEVKTLNEFEKSLEKKDLYDCLVKDRDSKMEILDNLLANMTFEELQNKAIEYNGEHLDQVKDINKSLVINKIKEEEALLSAMTSDFVRIEERIYNLNGKIKELLNIEEDIYRCKKTIQSFDNKIQSINMAKEVIKKISKEIHNQFAPVINREASKVIDLVTNGKYNKIKINDALDIAIENPTTGEIIDIDNLSGGTIDQLYFALRFSIINAIGESKLPLILDDCFMQYDNERLKNILEFLGRKCNEKQILLFTCHRRESEILDKLGLKYNMIKID